MNEQDTQESELEHRRKALFRAIVLNGHQLENKATARALTDTNSLSIHKTARDLEVLSLTQTVLLDEYVAVIHDLKEESNHGTI